MAGSREERQGLVLHGILTGAEWLLSKILRDPQACEVREQGFSFDMLWDDTRGTCELVELNPFGADSPCGSCLFHWIRDWDVLYGNTPSEFRVAMPTDKGAEELMETDSKSSQ